MRNEWFRGIITLIAVSLLVLLLFTACSYNFSRQDLCVSHGLEMAQNYFTRDYGCADVIPFDEVEKWEN